MINGVDEYFSLSIKNSSYPNKEIRFLQVSKNS